MGENAAVTPVGKPDAVSVTLPVKQATAVGVMVTVPLLPSAMDRRAGDEVSEKLCEAAATVRAIVVDAVREPDTPVIVTLDVPIVVPQPAVSVSTLLPVAGFVPNDAVTPLGRPDAVRVTLPAKGLTSVIVMASVTPLPPRMSDNTDAEGLSVKLPP